MRFEEVKQEQKEGKIQKMIRQFQNSKFEKVEVINEGDYENNARMVAAIRWVVRTQFDNQVKVSKIKDRVYLSKIKK